MKGLFMRFNVGDKAVYPAHGVTFVRGVESKKVSGQSISFYILEVKSSGATIMVPVDAAEKAGMRSLMSGEDISLVFSILSMPSKLSQKAWNKRIRQFNEKIRTGSISEVAEVIRDLWYLKSTKDLSYGEKKILEKSKELLVSEISASRNSTTHEVESEMEAIYSSYTIVDKAVASSG